MNRLDTLFEQYRDAKKRSLMWLFCYLYNLKSMRSIGECTPSSHTIRYLGKRDISLATVKRYLSILIEAGLIERTWSGREHKLYATQRGNAIISAMEGKNTPSKNKAYRETELLSKDKYICLYIDYTKELYKEEYSTKKPQFSKKDMSIMQLMLKNHTKSRDECEKVMSEIVFEIANGRLMCKQGTGTYHAIPNAINIAVSLFKNGKWKSSDKFDQEIYSGVRRMIEQEKIKCDVCGKHGKRMIENGKSVTLCEDHYFDKSKFCDILGNIFDQYKDIHSKSKLNTYRYEAYKYICSSSVRDKSNVVVKKRGSFICVKSKKTGKWAALYDQHWLSAMQRVENVVKSTFKSKPLDACSVV